MTTSPKLEQAVTEAYKHLHRGAVQSAGVYFISRITLIVASAIVAADKNLAGSNVGWLVGLVPALSLIVAVIAAGDTWYRPLSGGVALRSRETAPRFCSCG